MVKTKDETSTNLNNKIQSNTMIEKFIQCGVINICTKLTIDHFAQAKEIIKKTKNIYLSLLTNIFIQMSERPLYKSEYNEKSLDFVMRHEWQFDNNICRCWFMFFEYNIVLLMAIAWDHPFDHMAICGLCGKRWATIFESLLRFGK